MSDQQAAELLTWYRSFGDPNGPEYLSLQEINDGLELVDKLKEPIDPEETIFEMCRLFGFHPPSMVDYVNSHTQSFVRHPQAAYVAWFDGLWVGCAIYMLLAMATVDE